jgi:hypothetical protein
VVNAHAGLGRETLVGVRLPIASANRVENIGARVGGRRTHALKVATAGSDLEPAIRPLRTRETRDPRAHHASAASPAFTADPAFTAHSAFTAHTGVTTSGTASGGATRATVVSAARHEWHEAQR